ncbi:hypothetical protein [Rhodoferax koreensis]|nr:hypothetical protein [Rhodoferax koreense]
MKPRIRLIDRMWACRRPSMDIREWIGFGYTPKEAYEDWLEVNK